MSLKQKTVLVMDDDQDMLKLLDKILTGAGFSVLSALNPEEARSILKQTPPHVIISDLHMEPEDGFSFIRSIKVNRQYLDLPILVLSALNDFSSVKKALALGVSDYVIKPLQSQMLIRKLNKVLFNNDFAKWEVPTESPVFINATFSAKITALGESGFTLCGPFRLESGKEIKVTTQEFSAWNIDYHGLKTSNLNQTFQTLGNFSNDVTFVGIGKDSTSAIKRFLEQKGKG